MNLVSFGGGTNSTAMIIGMHKRGIPIDLILFADTGGEQPHTYDFIRTFNGWLNSHGLPEITPVHYTDKDGNRLTLEKECFKSGTLPSIAYGYKRCSLKHKIGPQEKFCNHVEQCKLIWKAGGRVDKYIGYDAGETRRINHAAPINAADKKYKKNYPLYEWGWDRDRCRSEITAAGLPLPGKSSCYFCPSMKKLEIQALWENYPELFRRAVEMERNAAPSLKKSRVWAETGHGRAITSSLCEISSRRNHKLDKGPSTVKNALNELEAAELIERRRCGNGMPNRIYEKQPDSQKTGP